MTTRSPTIALCLLSSLLLAPPAHAEASCSQTIQGPDALVDVRCEAPPLLEACIQVLANTGNGTTVLLENVTVGNYTPIHSNPSC